MKKKREWLGAWYERAGRGVSYWLFLAICLFLALNSLVFTSVFDIQGSGEYILYERGRILPGSLALAAVVGVAVCLGRLRLWRFRVLKRPEWWVFGIHLAAGVAWVLLAGAVQVNEPGNISRVAVAFAQGDASALEPGGYAFLFPFQLGFIGYIELVYAVAGAGNTLAVSLLNALAMALCSLFVVKIVRRLFHREAVTLAAAGLVLACVYMVPYTTFNYAILPGACLALAGALCALCFLGEGRPGWLAASAACTALATILKSNYLIFAVGVALVLLADLLRRPGWAKAILLAVLIAANLWGLQLVYGVYGLRFGVEVDAGVPQPVWVAMGVSNDAYSGPGWYNGLTYEMYEANGYDRAATSEAALAVVKQRAGALAGEPLEAVRFFYKKLLSEWNEPTWESLVSAWPAIDAGGGGAFWALFQGGRATQLYDGALDILHLAIMAFAAFGVAKGRRALALAQLGPAIIVIGGFLFFLVWEAKSQYLMVFGLLLIPYAALGLVEAAKLARRFLESWREKRHKNFPDDSPKAPLGL